MLDVHLRHDFDGFSLDAAFQAPSGVTALLGPSGAGKTSIVKAVSGILKVSAAKVSVGGTVLEDSAANIRLPIHKRRIGYVFQEPRLFPHMSVAGNLRYGMSGGDFEGVVKMLGIGPLLNRRPGALSGGEAQRVAIGRAVLTNPRLLLLDEPLAALDEARKSEILPYIERLRDTGIPILYVSHSVPEIARLATTIVALENGRVLRAGPAADILSDLDLVPALGIREAGAILTARVVSHHADGLTELAISSGTLWLPRIPADPGTPLRIRIEAQDVMLSKTAPSGISALNILPVTIQNLRMGEGPGAIARLSTGQDHLLARVTRRSADTMALSEGWQGYAVVKSVAVASGDVSTV